MRHFKEFQDVVERTNDYVRQLKKNSGKKIVGYSCSYMPEEIILAAGAHPVRLFGTKEHIHLADSYLQTYCCSLARGIMEEGMSGRVDYLDGIVFPHTCDSIQRLSDIWRMNVPYGFHLDLVLPVKLNTDSARDYMLDILKKFRTELGDVLKVDILDENLQKAIRTTNAIRQCICELYRMRSQNPDLLKGHEFYTLTRASMIMEREHFLALISETIAELKEKAGVENADASAKRIVLAGGICNQPDIYTIVEEVGGVVAWDDFCTGTRYFEDLIDEEKEPLSGIAARLLERVVCPAKHKDLDGRARHIISIVQQKNASGVVFMFLKFCDPHAFDYPYLKKSLDEAKIPVMLLEIEDPLPAHGQLKTRFEAFLEML